MSSTKNVFWWPQGNSRTLKPAVAAYAPAQNPVLLEFGVNSAWNTGAHGPRFRHAYEVGSMRLTPVLPQSWVSVPTLSTSQSSLVAEFDPWRRLTTRCR